MDTAIDKPTSATPSANSVERPGWLEPTHYPFAPHHVAHSDGVLHYVDEGSGSPLVMTHGTPTWSYLYRHYIRDLSPNYRCLALDNLGFGLSDKPAGADYTPEAHAKRFAAWVDALGLRDIVLFVHDFGGPIGLYYALHYPDNVRALVISNTWMWSNEDNRSFMLASRLLGGSFGRWLYVRHNLAARFELPMAFADRKNLGKTTHQHYLEPSKEEQSRYAAWVFAQELGGSNDFYESLWQKREAIADKPALLLWGIKDPLIKTDALARWQQTLRRAETVELGVGHFVPEEGAEEARTPLHTFLAKLS